MSRGLGDVYKRQGDSLFQYGNSQSGDEKDDTLLRAKNTLYQFALNSTPEVDEETWNKFDTLYKEVQTVLGEIPEALERPQEVVAVPSGPENNTGEGTSPTTKTVPEPVSVAPPDREDPSYGMAAVGFLAALLIVGGAFFFFMKKPKKTRRVPGRGDDAPVAIAMPAAGATVSSPKPQPKRRPPQQPAAAEAKAAASQPVKKKKKSIEDLTPEEKAALKKKLLAKKKAEAAKAAQAKKSEES